MSRVRFVVILDDQVYSHFSAIPRQDHSVLLDIVEQQLTTEPVVQTRNRKPVRIPNTVGATWELRCGRNNRYRIFYDVDIETRVVVVLAIGVKIRNRLMIGGEEFIL
jgi:mRNA-degrading endonuclease RelE of RelBE toxin-antitoxin system